MECERSLRVLIADDEDILRHVTSIHLMRMGHHVDEVSDGEQAFDAISSGNYDLAILDYRMSRLDGLEVLRKVREAEISLAILILSGYWNEESREIAKRLGALDLLRKPLKLANLKHFLAEHF